MTEFAGIHRLAAVLSTDVVGYSAFISDDEALTDQVVTEVLSRKAAIVLQHEGRITHTAGDGFIAVFESALSALGCAVAMSRTLGDGDSIHGEPIRFRTGL